MDRLFAVRFLARLTSARNSVGQQQFHSSVRLLNAQDSSSSSDSSDSDVEKRKKTKGNVAMKRHQDEAAKQQTVDLLNDLLLKMNGENTMKNTIDLAVPAKKPFPKPIKMESLEEKLKVAAKEAAESLGGDVKKREEELLDKIFSAGAPTPAPALPFKVPSKNSKKKKKKKQKLERVQAQGENVVEGEGQGSAEQESASNKKEEASEAQVEPSLSEILSAMNIDTTRKQAQDGDSLSFSRAAKIQQIAQKFQSRTGDQNAEMFAVRAQREVPGALYTGKAFNIFGTSRPSQLAATPQLSTWNALAEQELKSLVTHPPENYFEEMIQWTERGILWKFPIDNEQGMEAEQSVHFSEHVFLERHITDWCPTRGPIRQFMELVCTGLSKNPYMTVEEKKEHLVWFRDYFGDKQALLKEIGAIDRDILPEGAASKQIEA